MATYQCVSDLHLEFLDNRQQVMRLADRLLEGEKPEGTILLIAGDLEPLLHKKYRNFFLSYLAMHGHYQKIFVVPGNHEFYGMKRMPNLYDDYPLPQGSKWLARHANKKDVRGCTLWFPGKDPLDEFYYKRLMNGQELPFIEAQKEWAEDAIYLRNSPLESIFVTHHIPSPSLVDKRYFGAKTNAFFVSYADKILEERKPRVWLFGHTHHSADVVLGSTRCICNPLGYWRGSSFENERDFNWNLLVEV